MPFLKADVIASILKKYLKLIQSLTFFLNFSKYNKN